MSLETVFAVALPSIVSKNAKKPSVPAAIFGVV
jgi:hypothetical protein